MADTNGGGDGNHGGNDGRPLPPSPPLPEDPAAKSNLDAILSSPTYLRAQEDLGFLARRELRGVRLMLELEKADFQLDKEGIKTTVVVFGGARLKEGDRWYEEAREFGRIVSSCQASGMCEFVITTGGGPGAMEAANRGAWDSGAKTVGLNIQLPHEQYPNAYITPSLCFQFHYFGIRKMHLLMRARALVAFPGGFGTLDELFETLTLVQTGKMKHLPIVLVSRAYWEKLVNWQFLVDEGAIAKEDLDLITWAESAAEAWDAIVDFYSRHPASPGSRLR
ncbi:MAG TPA: TIGR00730 family Rossman fold protein [Thermoanaerobaculia bacterium]|nr:TIGR00730 family Rossman fold protein [Thermoanaerobaculia bacterium]